MGSQRIKILTRMVDDMHVHSYSRVEMLESVRLRWNKKDQNPIPESAKAKVEPADYVVFDYEWED